ncbi:hypothetical protein PLACP1_26730 [Planifilum fimeticola]
MGKKHPFPIAIRRIGAAPFGRGRVGVSGPGAAACRIYLHGACSVTFIRGRRDRSPWREEGRKLQLCPERDQGRDGWTDKAGDDRLNCFGFVRDPWRREPASTFPPSKGDRGRRAAAGESHTISREERDIDQPGSFVGRVSGVGADR